MGLSMQFLNEHDLLLELREARPGEYFYKEAVNTTGRTLVSFFDGDYLISSYFQDTLMEVYKKGEGISLEGGQPRYVVDYETLEKYFNLVERADLLLKNQRLAAKQQSEEDFHQRFRILVQTLTEEEITLGHPIYGYDSKQTHKDKRYWVEEKATGKEWFATEKLNELDALREITRFFNIKEDF